MQFSERRISYRKRHITFEEHHGHALRTTSPKTSTTVARSTIYIAGKHRESIGAMMFRHGTPMATPSQVHLT